MSQSLLIPLTWSLDTFRQCGEDLFGYIDCFAIILFSTWINDVLARIVPVKIHHTFLKSQQVIHSIDDYIDSGRVSSLCSKVVLKVQIVPFTKELNEPEEGTRKFFIMHILLSSCSFRSNAKSFRFLVPFKGIQIKDGQ